jgi:L-asparaginase
MKEILLLGTGGTIAEVSRDGKAIMLTASELVASVGPISSIASVRAIDFLRVPSPAIQFTDLLNLSSTVQKELKKGKPDGVIVTMGTDTLEESAYFLDLTVETSVPLVVTGAMRSRIDPSSDTDYNLECAVRAASSDSLRDLGAVVVMNGEIHHARYVSKTNTGSVGSFQSPGFGPLGVISGEKVMLNNTLVSRQHVTADNVGARVDLIRCCVGLDGSPVEAAVRMGAKGIVIEGFGGGDVTLSMVPAVREALAQGVAVVLVSRCITGPIVQPALDFEGSPSSLAKDGVIIASNTSGVKARIKLTLALSAGLKGKRLKSLF